MHSYFRNNALGNTCHHDSAKIICNNCLRQWIFHFCLGIKNKTHSCAKETYCYSEFSLCSVQWGWFQLWDANLLDSIPSVSIKGKRSTYNIVLSTLVKVFTWWFQQYSDSVAVNTMILEIFFTNIHLLNILKHS